jgi:hypothetical protein
MILAPLIPIGYSYNSVTGEREGKVITKHGTILLP